MMNSQTENSEPQKAGKSKMRRILPFLPLLVFAVLAAIFFTRIGGDNSTIPSVLIGKPAPQTDLPPLAGMGQSSNLSNADFIGKTTIVNVWASWCVPCRQEHPIITQLASDKRFQVVGINYKDSEDNARSFLKDLGNPFAKIGVDTKGKNTIDWGVYGVPETFIIDKNGIITHKHIGPLTAESLKESFMPALEKALQVEQK